MSNLKALKVRINSVKSTQKMTKAMKMVAASRLKKAKHLAEISRPYSDKIRELISGLASNISHRNSFAETFPLLTGNGKTSSRLFVVITSDRGLCGGVNSTTVRFAKSQINAAIAAGQDVKIFCIGRKGYDQLRSIYKDKITYSKFGVFKSGVTYESAYEIASIIIDEFKSDKFDVCDVIYTKFKSAISSDPVMSRLIPAQIEIDPSDALEGSVEYDPSEEGILSQLLPRYVGMQIYNELLENNASEQGARMAAMEAATTNAAKMIKGLTLVYNRSRQANITRELIDIVSGANSING